MILPPLHALAEHSRRQGWDDIRHRLRAAEIPRRRRRGDDRLPRPPSARRHARAGAALPRAGSGSTTGAPPTAIPRRSSPASSCATRTGRWARSGSTAPSSSTSPWRSRGRGAARASTWTAPCASRAGRRCPDDPPGDLVQAGPLLVHDGRTVVGGDTEGFSAGSGQFDSDITVGRYPRCALGVGDDELLAVCCDGRRSGVDAGLELARARAADDLVRRPRGDQPRRRRIGDARPPRAPPQPPVLERGPAGARSRGRW